ncbi:MAG: hypothetical protein N2559_08315 [Anaerolineae bacterium]|nr:hypothetical protein [Anaerolineae bacterium]
MFLLVGIALIAGAGLAFQIALTRIFAIAQGYHFGFLAISLALLGFGASGTALALRPMLAHGDVMRRLAQLSLVFSLCLVASYLAINYLPFDAYRVTLERIQLVYLVLYYLALVVPFFVGGLVLGLPLAAFPVHAARAYAANLAGSGLGCVAALGALTLFGEVGAIIFAAILAALGAGAFALDVRRETRGVMRDARGVRREARLVIGALGLVVVWSVLLIAPPRAFDVQLSPYRSLSQTLLLPDARIVFSATNAFSRVQVVESRAIRSAPGLSLTYRGDLPMQRALFKDAESISPLTDTAPVALLDALPVTLAYRLRPNARALIIEPGGGLEVLAALNASAREIVVIEENPLIADVARAYAPRVFTDARVRVVTVGARSFLARTREKFDVVHLALSEPFRPVTAGAYTLGENYLYTREALREYLEHLTDDGILVMHRWLQLPPTEETRAGALAITALEDTAVVSRLSSDLLALRSFSTMLILVKRTPFTVREIEIARAFADAQQFDWVAAPNLDVRETNRYHFLPHNDYFAAFQPLFDASRRASFIANYAYDITPPTDDRPFFFHFFKWEQTPQVLQLLGKTWQPFGGSGYLILFALLALSVLASVALILAPLIVLRANFAAHLARTPRELTYFAALGIGFLFIEIPLIQRFILFLDHPVYAFATVVFALLLASGAGSSISARVPLRGALIALVAAILIYPLILPFVFRLALGYPFEWRVIIALAFLAPLGFLMGIPFPKGIARLNANAPSLVPLAWGINGCASVISSILSTMGALTFGFGAVMLAGAGAYVGALLIAERGT